MQKEELFLRRRAALSAAKQALLEKWLQQETPPGSDADAIAPRPAEEMAPLSFAQLRLWFLQQLEPESPAYNEPMMARLSGPLNLTAFTRAVRELTRRHEVLRSTFTMADGQVAQVIAPAAQIDLDEPLSLIDLSHIAPREREAEVQRRAREALQRPFDLSHERPWRTVLLRLGEQEHVQITIMHHLITDAWTMAIFFREIGTLYDSFCAAQPSPLAPLPLQYADYAHWQQQRMASGKLDEQIAYWKRQLGDAPPSLDLPADHPHPLVQNYQGRRFPLQLPRALSQGLQALSRQEGVTLFMTLLAAFNVWLYRYTQQEDIVVGTPVAGRVRPELEALLGCFVNTLALRTDLSGNPPFRDVLQRVKQTTLQAYDHQEVPFEKLVEELHPERDLSHNPLFQVMFILQNGPVGARELAGLTITSLEMENQTAKFDLSLCLEETEQGLSGYLEYSSDLFEASSIEQMQGHLLTLLQGILADPNQRIGQLPFLTERERWRMLEMWNTSEVTFPREYSLSTLFEEQAAHAPEAVALVCEGEQISYGELNRRANRLAHHLRELGVGPETVVALLAERGIALVTAILAVFKAGGAYLPLDPRHPVSRLRQAISHSRSSLVLTVSLFTGTMAEIMLALPEHDRPRWEDLEILLQQKRADEDEHLPCGVEENQLAYVIYTSGSTGIPKGAMVEQAGMLNHLFAKIAALQLTEADSVAQTASQCFDISVWQMLSALLVGGSVCIYPDEVAHDPQRLLEAVASDGVSILETVPALLRALLESVEGQRDEQMQLPKLRWLIPTGEALPGELCQRWLALYPTIPLLNAYGPTECSDDVTHSVIERVSGDERGTMPIGTPVPGLRLYVLNRQGEPMPCGAVGEIYVGGIGVGRGYVGEPGKTAEVFVPDAFGEESGGRLYKTGDVGRYRADGVLEFLGRVDQQVKVRGYRVELGEIEAVLGQQPGVKECVVMARGGQQKLVGYVVWEAGARVEAEELQRGLRETLPDYMVPTVYIELEALPLTANGKLDRERLPEVGESKLLMETQYEPPRTPVEEQLARIWAEVLEVERVGIHDNFFELGGHSLLIMQIIARVRDDFQVDMPVRTLFKTPTVAGLNEAIERVKARNDELRKPTLTSISRDAYRKKRSVFATGDGNTGNAR
jgi:amino acid adenylation domain-containing protein